MKTSNRFVAVAGIASVALLLGALSVQAAEMFNNVTNVNVMREFIFGSTTNLVTSTQPSHIEGSGANDNWFNGDTPGTSVTTYTLPGLRTVSSFSANYEAGFDSPASLTWEGSANGGATWSTLGTYSPINPPGTTLYSNTFTAMAVNKLRLTQVAASSSGNYYNRTKEVQVFMDASAPAQQMYGDYAGAFSYLRDLRVAGKITPFNSPNNAVWNSPESASITQLTNGDTWQLDGVRDSLTADATQRVYYRMNLDKAYQMNYATLGSDSSGNQWGAFGNAEFYTHNGSLLDPSGIGSSIAALQGQGWVLQKAWTADAANAKSFLLSQPGLYNQILLVWDEGGDQQSGRLTNFELFAAMPEPASLALLAMGGLLLARRRQRD